VEKTDHEVENRPDLVETCGVARRPPAATTQTVEPEGQQFMAIPRGYRFNIVFDNAFPQGLVLIGDVAPDNEYQTREEKAAGRPVRQKLDEVTGTRQWKATVTDPGEPAAKRASFEITLTANVQPVPTTTEVLPGMRPIELDGLTAEPRVAGNGEFKYQSYVYRAPASPRRPPLPGPDRRSQSNRAAPLAAVSSPVKPRESRDGPQRGHAESGYWSGGPSGHPAGLGPTTRRCVPRVGLCGRRDGVSEIHACLGSGLPAVRPRLGEHGSNWQG
jgi:hypothetical protein